MKVLVTGNLGYLGAILVPRLQQHGHEVTGLDCDLFRACTFTGDLPAVPTLDMDIRDVTAAQLDRYDAVIHLAGLSNDPLGDYQPLLTAAINCAASARLARLARDAGVSRFLFASSCSIYGAAGDTFLDEAAARNPVTPYGASKLEAERAIAALADDDFSPVFLRAATAYGVSPRLRFDLVVNNLTAWAVATGRVLLKSDGTPWRPVVHVDDVAGAYVAALEAPRAAIHNQAFNVGQTTENYRIRDLAALIAGIVPGCRIEYAADAAPDQRCYRVDCNRIARQLPAFKPEWTVHHGVEQLYRAYRKAALQVADFEGPRFCRIGHLKELARSGKLCADLRWQPPVDIAEHEPARRVSGVV